MSTNTNARESLSDHCLIYNERSACFKKTKKKWKQRLTDTFYFPVQDFSEDWLKRQSFKSLIVMGGDGTVHSVANIILRSGLDIQMRIIPSGGGNDFFKRVIKRECGFNDPENITRFNVLELEYQNNIKKKYASNTIEWGIGAIVAAKRDKNEGRFLIGMLKYFYLVIKSLFEFNSWKASIYLDGKYLEFNDLSSVLVGFGSSTIGSGYILFPEKHSGPDKDKPFVFIAEGFSRFNALGLILKFIRGKQSKDPNVKCYAFSTLELIPHDIESIMLTIDGELSPSPPVKISVSDKQLNVSSYR